MMMFLNKLLPDELHLLLEYTQMLLDYLTLPAAADWRDTVIAQGKIEARDPGFHRNLNKLRQQVRIAEGVDQTHAKAHLKSVLESTERHEEDKGSSSDEESDHGPIMAGAFEDNSEDGKDSQHSGKEALGAGPNVTHVMGDMPEALGDEDIDLMLDDVSLDESIAAPSSDSDQLDQQIEQPLADSLDVAEQVRVWAKEEEQHNQQETLDVLGEDLRGRIENLRRRMGAGAMNGDNESLHSAGGSDGTEASGSEIYEPKLQPAIPQAYGNKRTPMADPQMSPRSIPDERMPRR